MPEITEIPPPLLPAETFSFTFTPDDDAPLTEALLEYKQCSFDEKERRFRRAIKAIQDDESYSVRQASRDFGVPLTTLQGRLNGRQAKRNAHEEEKHFDSAQEEVIVAWIVDCGRRGVPITQSSLRQFASDFCGSAVGQHWPRRFLFRHRELATRIARPLEACRAKALNRTNVNDYFDMLTRIIHGYDIGPSEIYNMDEKGIILGAAERTQAIVDRDQKTVYDIGSGSREFITVIECVSAVGKVLAPSVIFKAERLNLGWGSDNPCRASISKSPNGWTDQELGAKWLEHDFHPQTKALLPFEGAYRLLILDGHNSHSTYRFCSFARDHNIIVICLPPHTTHALQPLDVVIFAPLQKAWKAEAKLAGVVTKSNFLRVYHNARSQSMKPRTVINGFIATGIWPLNQSIIPDEKFAPAENTTTKPKPLFAPIPMIIPVITPNSDVDDQQVELEPPPTHANTSTQTEISFRVHIHAMFTGPLPRLPSYAPKEEFVHQVEEYRKVTNTLWEQVKADQVRIHLANLENIRLRELAFKSQPPKRINDTSGARHLTSDAQLKAIAEAEQAVLDKEQEKIDRQAEKERKAEEKKQKEEAKQANKARLEENKPSDLAIKQAMDSLVAYEKLLLKPARTTRKRKQPEPESDSDELFDLDDINDDSETEAPTPLLPPPPPPSSSPRPTRARRTTNTTAIDPPAPPLPPVTKARTRKPPALVKASSQATPPPPTKPRKRPIPIRRKVQADTETLGPLQSEPAPSAPGPSGNTALEATEGQAGAPEGPAPTQSGVPDASTLDSEPPRRVTRARAAANKKK